MSGFVDPTSTLQALINETGQTDRLFVLYSIDNIINIGQGLGIWVIIVLLSYIGGRDIFRHFPISKENIFYDFTSNNNKSLSNIASI